MRNFRTPLNNLKVASPCSADWNEMVGDERKRFCGQCSLNVYDLSGMTREEAETLLINSEGRLCVRFFRRADGTVLTQDCPVGWARMKQRISKTATAAFSLVAGLFGGLFAFTAFKPSETKTMGAMMPTSNQPIANVNFDPEPITVMGAIAVDTSVPGEFEAGRISPVKPTRRK